MTGSLCTLRIRLLGSEPSSHLFMEVGEFWKEHVFIVFRCCFLEAVLSPKPCCARQCINTEKETGELKSGKELSPRGKPEKAHSWVPDAQSFALYLVDHKQLLRKQSKYTTARRIYCYANGSSLGGSGISVNHPKGILGNHEVQRLLSQSFISTPFKGSGTLCCCLCSPSTHLDFISHLKLSWVLLFYQEGGGTQGPVVCPAADLWLYSAEARCRLARG